MIALLRAPYRDGDIGTKLGRSMDRRFVTLQRGLRRAFVIFDSLGEYLCNFRHFLITVWEPQRS